MPLQRFGIVRDGEPLLAIPLKHSVRTGISFEDARIELGMISEFEEREAATFVSIPWTEWVTIDPRERAAMVAHRRMHNQVSLHSHDAVTREADARRKRAEVEARQARGA